MERIAAGAGVFPWTEIVRSDRDDPLPRALRGALAKPPECPEELLVSMSRKGLPVDDESTLGPDAAPERGALSPHDLLRHARPAARALSLREAPAGPGRHDRHDRRDGSTPCPDAGALLHAPLETDPDTWIVAIRLIARFTGRASPSCRTPPSPRPERVVSMSADTNLRVVSKNVNIEECRNRNS
ncbi:hypothetical protein [Embleya scabrispora]|uniref:hypothetical protein n=1 Tax=Embleya scabrispora TaxID=159449 RepID=UPI00036938CB|nr:hypothetical protein [Embleya scabrispora]MYS80516.1 hypothetical protein [Streptomyces sp. SID5474]